jgi:hypothetical protein
MARYKEYDYRQGKFIPISFDTGTGMAMHKEENRGENKDHRGWNSKEGAILTAVRQTVGQTK